MLRIIQSNRMEALQTQFNAVLALAPLDSLFKKEVVLVQSPGMSQWLKIGICETVGVSAQIDFPLPSSFIWRLYQSLLSDIPKESAFNKPNLAWKIVSLLPSCLTLSAYEPLKKYLDDDTDGLKRFSLSEKIADVFDQYLMYRPDWLALWEDGYDALPDTDVSAAPWQPDLWRKLVQYTNELGQSPWHRANMHNSLLAAILRAPSHLLPERISIFGISALPPSQIEIFEALAQRTEVLLYLFNPSEHYWGDLTDEKTLAKIKAKYAKSPNLAKDEGDYFQVGNPLLASWGKLGKEYLEQLLTLDAQWLDRFQPDFNTTLLGQIQQEIYELAFKGSSLAEDPSWFVSQKGRLPVKQNDTTIRLQDCHTALREVELLHDYLLDCFAKDPSLTPKDIIVMMPDVGAYSPYIEAVFGGAKGDRAIPFAIADLALDQEKPVLQSFVQLVNLPFSRFKRSELMDLLHVDAIAEQFGVSEDEFEQLAVWLDRAAIKWGIDAKHKAEFALPELPLNTWQLGLNKLLLGYAQSDESTPFEGIYGLDEVEGMAVETLSKLCLFVDTLVEFKSQLAAEETLANKAALLQKMITAFYSSEAQSSWDLIQVNQVIETFLSHYEKKDFQGLVSPKVVAYLVEQGLKEKGVGQRFLIGSVNFCTLMPMRAVPFKVVCLLGMNDQDYPRQVQPIGFDLVSKSARRKGDRSRKFDDRYLFLEALLSARDAFYLSFIGRSCFNNEPQVPSVLVEELFEYIERVFEIDGDPQASVRQMLHIKAPLQPFSECHYQPGALHSYNLTWLLPNAEMQSNDNTTTGFHFELPEALDIAHFIRSVLSPQALFYQHSLGVKIRPLEEVEQDDEPFSLDALSRYHYLSQLLEAQLHDKVVDTEQWLQRGVLPHAAAGELVFEGLGQRVESLATVLKPLLSEKKEPREVRLTVAGVSLEGWLNNLYGDTQVFYRSASIKAKDRIAAFIWHCISTLMGESKTTLILGLDDQVLLQAISQEDANRALQDWLVFYKESLNQPMPFFANSSMTYVVTEDINKARQKFAGGQYIGRGDSEDPYVGLCFTQLDDIEAEFIALADKLLKPILAISMESDHAST